MIGTYLKCDTKIRIQSCLFTTVAGIQDGPADAQSIDQCSFLQATILFTGFKLFCT